MYKMAAYLVCLLVVTYHYICKLLALYELTNIRKKGTHANAFAIDTLVLNIG